MTAIFALLKQKDLMPKTKLTLYPSLKSAIRPVLHCTNVPVPVFKSLPDLHMVDNDDDDPPMDESTRNFDCQDQDYVMEAEPPQLLSQSKLDELVGDLSLSKESSELLGFEEKTSYFQDGGLLL